MYLPLGSTLARLLQLPLPSFSSGQSALPVYSVAPDERLQLEQSDDRRALIDLGILSPYHDAPAAYAVSPELPADCSVEQVILLHRHGSRGPVMEQIWINQLVSTLDKAYDIIQATDLPPYLQFLKEGYKSQSVPQNLTVVGRKELFYHGIEFASRYSFLADVVVSTNVPRVIESAHYFSQGFFGLDAEDVTFLTTKNFSDPVSWLDPWIPCPEMDTVSRAAYQAIDEWAEKYVPRIVDRFNKLIPGVNFTLNDVRGALYACPYDRAAQMASPWCDVFTADELQDLEYELDLLMDVVSGHKGDPGPFLGGFYVKKLLERLTAKDPRPLYLEFAHDTTILVALANMGLNKDEQPLTSAGPPPNRKFRASYQAPFAARMVWEKFTCETSFGGQHTPQVRLVLNGATFPLSTCAQSEDDKTYGTCSLAKFVEVNADSLNAEYHNAEWNATCELGN